MRIALIGSRGIPARYSGFETFYEQLGVRLAQRGHDVTVYNRSHFIKDVFKEYRRVRIVTLPSIPSKHLDTITHTLLSAVHAVFQRYDVAYFCIVGNSPLAWIPRLGGAKTLLNVDGQDSEREKWAGFARWYQRRCEWIACRTGGTLIADSKVIQQRYSDAYRKETVFVPYGANIRRDERLDALKRWGVADRRYLLFVGRLVPENGVDLLIRAFQEVKGSLKLVIVGDAPYMEEYKARLRAMANDQIVFTGYVFGDDYAQLSSHAYLYVQPSGVNGTRPALLDQMGFGNAVLVRNSPSNVEVAGEYGFVFEEGRAEESLVTELQRLADSPGQVERMRSRVAERIRNYYNWDWITDCYEEMFRRLLNRQEVLSYTEFLARRQSTVC